MPLTRTIAEVLKAHSDGLKDDLRVCLPGTVTAVDAETQTVDVQVAVKNPVFDDDGNVSYVALPSFKSVPLAVTRGGQFFVWVPVEVGDSVMLIFTDLSLDTWVGSDPAGGPVQPGWVGKHTADSLIAVPCIAPSAAAFVDPGLAAGKVIIGKDGTDAQMRVSGTAIEFGVDPLDAVGLASKIDTAVATIVTAFNAHTHVYSPGPSSPVPTAPPATPITNPATVASTLVKVKS